MRGGEGKKWGGGGGSVGVLGEEEMAGGGGRRGRGRWRELLPYVGTCPSLYDIIPSKACS